MAGTITVKPGESLTIVGVPADTALPPYIPPAGPVDPGFSPPWAQLPLIPTHPIMLPGMPGWPPIEPPIEPPPVQPPTDSGHWTWAWSPQAGRWVWVKVPGEGEAGPKA